MKNILIISAVVVSALVSVNTYSQSMTDQDKDMVHSITLPVVEVPLKQGPGLDKVSTLCNVCHTLGYVTMQPPLPKATWSAEVHKMIKVMGAPISEEDANTIIDYLAANYGTGK
jgi:cytochrome c5